MKWRKYQKQDLETAVKDSLSIRQTLNKLGIVPAGGNYHTIKKYIKQYDIDISHFKGQGWNKGRPSSRKRSLEIYFSNQIPIQSNKLRQRLLREQIFQHQCNWCKREFWNKKPIPLELDHIDGNNKNNSLSNLRLLCPNCHAQTSTYRGRNISKA